MNGRRWKGKLIEWKKAGRESNGMEKGGKGKELNGKGWVGKGIEWKRVGRNRN